jgi:phosphate transport system substrate-binding protein
MKRLSFMIRAAWVLGFVSHALAEEPTPLEPYRPPENETQTLRIWGDRHMEGVAKAWKDAYHFVHPEITIDLRLMGNGTAMPALYLGLADIVLLGRDPIVTDNDGFAHVRKYAPRRVELATGSVSTPGHATALVLFVHRDNPLSKLTLAQVDAIFSSVRARGGATAIRTWGQLGLEGEWRDQPIHIHADDTQSMTGLFFSRAVLGHSRMMNWEHFTEYKDQRRADGTVLLAAEQTATALRGDRFGLAVSTLQFVSPENKPLALASREGDAYFAPTPESIARREYPLTRSVLAFVDERPGKPLDPKVADFLRYVLGPAGQKRLAFGDYLPLPEKLRTEELQKLP